MLESTQKVNCYKVVIIVLIKTSWMMSHFQFMKKLLFILWIVHYITAKNKSDSNVNNWTLYSDISKYLAILTVLKDEYQGILDKCETFYFVIWGK